MAGGDPRLGRPGPAALLARKRAVGVRAGQRRARRGADAHGATPGPLRRARDPRPRRARREGLRPRVPLHEGDGRPVDGKDPGADGRFRERVGVLQVAPLPEPAGDHGRLLLAEPEPALAPRGRRRALGRVRRRVVLPRAPRGRDARGARRKVRRRGPRRPRRGRGGAGGGGGRRARDLPRGRQPRPLLATVSRPAPRALPPRRRPRRPRRRRRRRRPRGRRLRRAAPGLLAQPGPALLRRDARPRQARRLRGARRRRPAPGGVPPREEEDTVVSLRATPP
mmetsp:Transcript_14418/g.49702  ORF Transcript_14418/g.49702 Transcript_14418/m.49702 type:complete len:281 (+) Transcript_14418:604-1446(+)